MNNYSHKIRSNFCHTHRVNPLKEWAEIAITIVEVAFCGLKGIKIETIEIVREY